MENNPLLNFENKREPKAIIESAPTCIVCHGTEITTLCDIDGYIVLTCHTCSTQFVWPMPDQQSLKKLYDRKEWFEGGEKGGYVDYDKQTEMIPKYLEESFAVIETDEGPKTVLDIGCGYGTHLAVAAAKGWECFGVEVSAHARKIARDRHGDNIYLVEQVEDLPQCQYDLILMLDVIEHLVDPYPLFYALFSNGSIGPQTRIIITTPNAKSCQAVAEPEKWAYRHPPSHLVYYSPQSLNILLKQLKWGAIEITGQYPISGFLEKPDNESSGLNKKLERYAGLLCTATGSDFSEFMHERYVPGTWNKITEYEHIPRYVMAQKLAKSLKVLDFGCGTGYGSALLAKEAESVVGVDISEEALQWAMQHHHNPCLRFELRDDLGAGLPESSFDLVTCFEMIEHVPQQTQESAIKNFRRLLGTEGKLIISTPNPNVTKNYGDNPYHLHEMSEKEFVRLLKHHFKHVLIFRQWIRPSVLIAQQPLFSSDDAVKVCSFVFEGQSLKLPAVAYIAICSDVPLPEVEGVCNFDSTFDFVAKEIADISSKHQSVNDKYDNFKEFRNYKATIKEKESAIQNKESAIQIMARNFEVQERNIEDLRNIITEKDTNLFEQAKVIHLLQEKITEKESAINIMARNFEEQERNIEDLRNIISEKDKNIFEQAKVIHLLQETITEKESAIQSMARNIVEYERNVDELKIALIKVKKQIEGKDQIILDIKQSLPFQLELLTRQKSFSLARSMKIFYLMGRMIAPESIKFFLKSSFRNRKVKNLSAQGRLVENKPYCIKPLLPILENRPKVVHVIGNFLTGGSSRLVADIIEHLGHFCEQEILTAYNPDPVSYTGIPVHIYYPLSSPQKVLDYLEKFQPDMMHIHYWGYGDKPWYEQAILAGEKFGCKIIENINTPVDPYLSDGIAKYVYVSDYVKINFGKGTSKELTIYPGSNFYLFSREQVNQVPDDCIGMVYRLEKDKLDEQSIDVFIEVAKRRPQTKILIVGGGPFVEQYSATAEKAGVSNSFKFAGMVNYSQLPDLYRQMSIFVAPVVRESFGQVTPFAMSMGIPVAGYDVGALSEILGSKECLAPVKDSLQLARIIISLLDDRDKRIEIGQFNKNRAQEKYSVEEMIRKYSVLYKEILGG